MCQYWYTFLSFSLPLLALIIFGAVMLTYEKEYLFRVQEQSLFLYTRLFFEQSMSVPAGLLVWLGCYLTQFFHVQYVGILLLLTLWGLLMWIFKQTFAIPDRWAVLCIIPVCILAITIFHLGYWIFYLKMQGYFFASTIGFLAATGLIWLFCLLPESLYLRTLFLILTAAICYPLIGCYALLAILIMGIITWRLGVLALMTIIATPLICYHTIYHSVDISDIWLAGIPQFQTAEKICSAYYIPYILLTILLIICSLLYLFPIKTNKIKVSPYIIQPVIFMAAGIITYANWYKDQNFHLELKMYRCMEQCDWERLTATMRLAEHPTRLMSVMNNLALFRLGLQGDQMYDYPTGNCQSMAPFEVRMLQTGGKLLYLNYGQANFCHRWCMEDGVEFGWRVEYFKCMVTSMLLNGENAAAQKYLSILGHTRYYKSWTGPDTEELKLMKRLMPTDDQLTSDNMLPEAFLLNHFANRDSDDPLAQEASLMFALQSCNSEAFLQRFKHYQELNSDSRIPRHCQEALCIYNQTDSIPVDETIRRNYQSFMHEASQHRNMSIGEVKPLMREHFGNTFFYNYFFNQ